MDNGNTANATPSLQKIHTQKESDPTITLQPHKLTEIVDMIDLMGKISERAAEDRSGDMTTSAGARTTTKGKKDLGSSTRAQAIANLPIETVMQQQLITHIRKEIRTLSREANALSRSRKKGSAYTLNELYKRIRRLTGLMRDIVAASIELVTRLYVALFIDKQPIFSEAVDSLVEPGK